MAVWSLLGLWMWGGPSAARAETNDGNLVPVGAPEKAEWYVSAKGGTSLFTNSRSLALVHLVKPSVRVEVGRHLVDDVYLGVELSGTVAGAESYRLLGGYLVGRAAMIRGEVFSMWLGWGAGAGTSPPILYTDLIRSEPLSLWWQMGLGWSWALIPDGFELGIDLYSESISVLTMTAVVQQRF